MPVRINNAAPTGYFARKRSTLGAALALTTSRSHAPTGPGNAHHQSVRAVIPINWSLTNTYSGIVSLYTDLIRLRRNLDGRSSGLMGTQTSTIWQDNVSKMIAYRRYNTGNVGDDVIVICNFANTNWPAYNITGFPTPAFGIRNSIVTSPSTALTTATTGASPPR